jgi:hypothetical protein
MVEVGVVEGCGVRVGGSVGLGVDEEPKEPVYSVVANKLSEDCDSDGVSPLALQAPNTRLNAINRITSGRKFIIILPHQQL